MDLMDILKSAGGNDSIGQLASAVGLGSDDTGKLISALAPSLMKGLTKGTGSADGLSSLKRALESGGHDRYIDRPDLMGSADTRSDGNKILGHIFGSKDVSRQVAADAEKETGIDAGLVKKALPLLATLAMGAMNKKTSAGQQSSGLGDILSMARKFF
ncbi:MAG: DUF937 domain-containing protein [Gammaproteobacteria bacterium]|nr:DUF937 domain-containing protein [Gammaproteobacteria bacterium]